MASNEEPSVFEKAYDQHDLLAIVHHILADPVPAVALEQRSCINGTEWFG
jgi:hypothetical protein